MRIQLHGVRKLTSTTEGFVVILRSELLHDPVHGMGNHNNNGNLQSTYPSSQSAEQT